MDVLAELNGLGAVLTDRHFVYTSGKHGSAYVNMDSLFPNVQLVSQLAAELAAPFAGEFEVVAAPATGGIVLSVLTALSAGVPGVWADKTATTDSGFAFERAGFAEHLAGKRVLVVEDLLTTGGSVAAVCSEVAKVGGTVIGVSVVCRRGAVDAEQLGVPKLVELAAVELASFSAEDCPLCAAGTPIVTTIGHGAEFQTEHPDYPGGYRD